jgi:hypothetical protein
MPDLRATRTLVKSPPELWAELSEVDGLARHLGEFGEIKIRRLEPERAISWEAERASGTVEIEASGWGTKVVLTAAPKDATHAPRAAVPEPQRTGFVSRWLFRERLETPSPPPEPAAPAAIDEEQAQSVLDDALDTLGSAHHRPFSRG